MNPYYFFPMPRFVPKNRLTEPPFSSPWYSNKRPGLYTCAVCKTPVFRFQTDILKNYIGHTFVFTFSSAHKYESGTGWPSFYSPYSPFSVATQIEYSSTSPDIEVHCAVV